MDELYLAVPSPAHKEQVMAFKAEMLEYGSDFDGCNGLDNVDTYEEWLDFRGREKRKPRHSRAVRKPKGRNMTMFPARLKPLSRSLKGSRLTRRSKPPRSNRGT